MQGGLALARIGYSGATEPSLAVLAELQRAFLLTVPFENLDIHLGREIVLDPVRDRWRWDDPAVPDGLQGSRP